VFSAVYAGNDRRKSEIFGLVGYSFGYGVGYMVGLARIELATCGLGNRRSIQLSYSPMTTDYHTLRDRGRRQHFGQTSPSGKLREPAQRSRKTTTPAMERATICDERFIEHLSLSQSRKERPPTPKAPTPWQRASLTTALLPFW
jgi:hypothetical protein